MKKKEIKLKDLVKYDGKIYIRYKIEDGGIGLVLEEEKRQNVTVNNKITSRQITKLITSGKYIIICNNYNTLVRVLGQGG